MNLLPCPFCGGEAVLETDHDTIQPVAPIDWKRVRCNKCNIRTTWRKSQAEAIEAWNHRAETTTEMLMRVLAYDATCGACDKRKERIAKVETYTDDQQETWSVCECGTDVWKSYNYCPECGAKLDWSE